MRVLVCPQPQATDGGHLIALELASAVQRYGHDVLVYASDGILARHIEEAGLERIPAVRTNGFGSGVTRLGTIVRERRIDLVHAYEWAPSVEAAFGPGLWRNIPVLMSVTAMEVPSFLPMHLPVTVGTAALAEREVNRRDVFLLEPPVDMEQNRGSDGSAARLRWGVGPGELVISIVSVLTTELEKLQGVFACIAMTDRLAQQYPVRLLIAGDGEGYGQVCVRAARVNARHRRTVVQVLGYQEDPSDVYDAADVVIGMGSSAIKGLAFGKPLIVQGAAGYWELVTPETAPRFLRGGWFGDGGRGARDLKEPLLELLSSSTRREELGMFGRRLVQDRYSLSHGARILASVYKEVADLPRRSRDAVPSYARSAVELVRFGATMRAGSAARRERWSRSGIAL